MTSLTPKKASVFVLISSLISLSRGTIKDNSIICRSVFKINHKPLIQRMPSSWPCDKPNAFQEWQGMSHDCRWGVMLLADPACWDGWRCSGRDDPAQTVAARPGCLL